MSDNKIKIVIYICIMVIFVGIAFLVMIFTREVENPDDIRTPITNNYDYSEVYDINEYQTIYNCINSYYTALNKNQNTVLNLLQQEYKNTHNISFNNLSDYVEKKYDNYNYSINKIKKYNNTYYSIYFLIGTYTQETLDVPSEEKSVKDIVIEDIANGTFSILPILNTNMNFEEVINQNGLLNYNQRIIENGDNEIVIGTMSEFNEAMLYFNDFVNNLSMNCNVAYSLMGENSKKNYSNFNDFQNVCVKYQNTYSSPAIMNYSFSYKDGNKIIVITDSYSNRYSFIVNSVKNYKVDIIVK